VSGLEGKKEERSECEAGTVARARKVAKAAAVRAVWAMVVGAMVVGAKAAMDQHGQPFGQGARDDP
jgi:hypothetical protein